MDFRRILKLFFDIFKQSDNPHHLTLLTPSRKHNLFSQLSSAFKTSADEGSAAAYHDYYPLSYVWGQSPERHGIILNGCSYEITTNRHDFLSQARHAADLRGPYRIDAICINQANDLEKGVQVTMMGDIYRGTRQCIV